MSVLAVNREKQKHLLLRAAVPSNVRKLLRRAGIDILEPEEDVELITVDHPALNGNKMVVTTDVYYPIPGTFRQSLGYSGLHADFLILDEHSENLTNTGLFTADGRELLSEPEQGYYLNSPDCDSLDNRSNHGPARIYGELKGDVFIPHTLEPCVKCDDCPCGLSTEAYDDVALGVQLYNHRPQDAARQNISPTALSAPYVGTVTGRLPGNYQPPQHEIPRQKKGWLRRTIDRFTGRGK